MEQQTPNNQPNREFIYNDIERRIRNNEFKNKEELSNYIINLKNRGIILQEEMQPKMIQFLGMYDELNQNNDMPLNMENYKGVGLENQNLIVSTESERILKTQESPQEISREFKQVQNEIIANNENALTNADTVFNHMANNQKEELTLIPVSEIFSRNDIDIDLLQKIKFFISNKYINPYSYKIDLEHGIFYNVETSEVLEVRKNEGTNEYQIYKGSEIVYGDELEHEQSQDYIEQDKNSDTQEEEKAYENRNRGKVRVLRLPQIEDYNNAAFSKINFLLLIISMFAVSITFISILNKFVK